MAKIKYFSECNGATVELQNVSYTPGKCLQQEIPAKSVRILTASGPNGFRKYDYVTGTCPLCNARHIATRKIEYKSNPSKHVCDARCVHATGKIMRCECSCGGKNHGKGSVAA